MNDAQTLLEKLEAWMRAQKNVLVAYSGGVDSALVLAAAHRVLGAEKSLGVIGVSPSYAKRELESALAVASEMNIPVRVLETHEHLDPNYAANPTNRCYFCKTELYSQLVTLAKKENWRTIADGNNASDIGDFRPGWAAAKERDVKSPLADLGITKENVRALAKLLNIRVWDKPASPCLSSRVPHGTAISPELLNQIEKAEDVLVGLGFRQFRVRHHGEIARIELPPADLQRALELREKITAGINAAGYKFITLDLAGFKSGGLNGATVSLRVATTS
jgi:uncharacterized protein